MRVVLDTNQIISGVFWSGASREVLQRMRDGAFQTIISEGMLDELRDVISREKFEKNCRKLGKSAQELVEDYLLYAQIITIQTDINIPQDAVRDGDDVIVLAAAISANVDYVVTGDDDLLSLGKYRGIPIISPDKFLGILL